MKYMKQFSIIIVVTLIGELLEKVFPLPVPASIYGLGVMLALLMSGVLKLEAVKESADFLIEIMPLMFIPAAAGLLDSWHELTGFFLPLAVVVAVTTVVVMAVTGKCAQKMIGKEKKEAETKRK